jgi:site-specific recombinase XerD
MNAVDRGVELWLDDKEQSTRLQYAAHINELQRMLARRGRNLRTATREDLIGFARSYHTYWARKRAITAVRSCYRFLHELPDLRFSNQARSISFSDVESDAAKLEKNVQLELFHDWDRRKVRSLTWRAAIDLIAPSSEIRAEARTPLYRLIALRFPGRRKSDCNTKVFVDLIDSKEKAS